MTTSADWDAEADRFDDQPDHGLRDPITRSSWLALLRSSLPDEPGRAADVGCGTGTLSLLLSQIGWDVDAVDFAPRMIERARTKLDATAVRVLLGDASDPPLPAGRFDAVVSRHVLWALPDRADAIARWVDLLRPVGRLVLIEGNWSTGAGVTADDCCDLLSTAGRTPRVTSLTDPIYWGGPITDERYLVVA